MLLVLVISFFSCTDHKQDSTPNVAIITGKVDVNWDDKIKLSNGAITLTDSWIDRLNLGDSIIQLEKDGTFKIELFIQKADFYILSHEANSIELFVSPNDSLYIDFNSENIVSGTSEKLNHHLKALRNNINTNKKYINEIDFYNQPVEVVDSILDSLKTAYVKVHKDFKQKNKVNDAFEKKILADITYRNKLYKISHPSLFKQKTGNALPIQATYYEDIARGSFDNPELLKSLDYVLFIESYTDAQSAGENKYDTYWQIPMEKIHPKYNQIEQLDAHQDIKDYLLHQHLNKSMDNYGMVYLKDLIPRFKVDCKNPALVKQIEERFQEGLERRKEASIIKIYKKIDGIELEAHIFYPEDFKEGEKRPAYLFFHGGGWAIGIPEWGYTNCKEYSSKGMVAISFEYRLIDIHKTNILDCIRDAKSAILWTREEAEMLGIDPNKIVAAGFSAGGHLAAATAIINNFDVEENTSGLSAKPNAIVIQSASYNTTQSNWFARQSDQKPKSISTFHHLEKGLVPSLFFHGTADHLAPISEFTEFKDKMDSLGNDYEYKIFEGVGHFFNSPEANKTVQKMTDDFLEKLGYIEKQ